MSLKTPLRLAIESLKEKGVIGSQKELMPLFEQKNEGNLTKLINSSRPNRKLVEKFEKKYNIRLSDYAPSEYDLGEAIKKIEAMSSVMLTAIAEVIANQKSQMASIVKNDLEKMVNEQLALS